VALRDELDKVTNRRGTERCFIGDYCHIALSPITSLLAREENEQRERSRMIAIFKSS